MGSRPYSWIMLVRIFQDQHPYCTLSEAVPSRPKQTCMRLDLSSNIFVCHQLRLQHTYTVTCHIREEFTALSLIAAGSLITTAVLLTPKHFALKLRFLLLRFRRKRIQRLNNEIFSVHLIRRCRRLIVAALLQLYCRFLQPCFNHHHFHHHLHQQYCQRQYKNCGRLLAVTSVIILRSRLHQVIPLNVCLLLLLVYCCKSFVKKSSKSKDRIENRRTEIVAYVFWDRTQIISLPEAKGKMLTIYKGLEI